MLAGKEVDRSVGMEVDVELEVDVGMELLIVFKDVEVFKGGM